MKERQGFRGKTVRASDPGGLLGRSNGHANSDLASQAHTRTHSAHRASAEELHNYRINIWFHSVSTLRVENSHSSPCTTPQNAVNSFNRGRLSVSFCGSKCIRVSRKAQQLIGQTNTVRVRSSHEHLRLLTAVCA